MCWVGEARRQNTWIVILGTAAYVDHNYYLLCTAADNLVPSYETQEFGLMMPVAVDHVGFY